MRPSDSGSPLARRTSSTPHYQTFGGITPPKSKGKPVSMSSTSSSHEPSNADAKVHDEHPLPKKQMAILAVISLCEQTALNSISPYLPSMVASFPNAQPDKIGVAVGTIASAFALAQLATNFFWGWLSDRIGRKPVILLGTILTAACFMGFGFVHTLPQAVLVQALMGAVNGNAGVVSTCLGEITDRSNQSRAFTYLPVLYGLGGITGPMIGGLLVCYRNPFNQYKPNPFPYLPPNLLSAAILIVDFVLVAIFLEESLEEAKYLPPLGARVKSLFAWMWQFTSSTRPSYLGRSSFSSCSHPAQIQDHSDDESSDDGHVYSPILPDHDEELRPKDLLNRDTILLLVSYLIFQLSNVSFNSLFPIFANAQPPTGRDLKTDEIGVSLAFAGAVTILFQVGLFGRLREKLGNRWVYRASLAGFVLSFLLMPWVGYKKAGDSNSSASSATVWLWIEIGFVLLIKTVAAVGGLTSALLLVRVPSFWISGTPANPAEQVTNSAPNHAVLGALNGLAQTLSAAGRAVGPFLSGGLFSIATKVQPKGEAMAFGVFGGIAFIGFLLSFGIRSCHLEAEGWKSDDDVSDKSDDEDEQS
ncbi:hypothetical protein DV738_g1022, partial [Chaetothyriales sp. CBS 135597]